MLFEKYFLELGFSKKETTIFQTVYKLGTQPASVIAKYANLERTYVYKVLLKLCDENLISQATKNGIKYFFIPDINILKKYVKQKKDKYKNLEDDYSNIELEFLTLNKDKKSNIPKISMYEGIEGLKNLYDDILNTILSKKILSIKLFASNTVETMGGGNEKVKEIREIFLNKLKENKINTEAYLGNGISLMENLGTTSDIEGIKNLPISNSSINIFVVGDIFFLIIYKDIPISLKINSEELAFSMHFILEHLK